MARILIIEDEAVIAGLLVRALTAEGFIVDAAADAAKGLHLARTRHYNAVLLDLMLPGTSGTAILKELASTQPELPVIVVSAISDANAKVRCFELGAADYLAKPFDLDELLARVRARMRARMRRRGEELSRPERLLRAGSVALDLELRTADSGRGPIALTERECKLLEYLMMREGQVATRDELLKHVWGFSFDPGTNVVDVYVGRLRSKLGSKLIHTVRGVGYVLLPDGDFNTPAAVASHN